MPKRKVRVFDSIALILDRRSKHKEGLKKIAEYGKKTGAIHTYRIVKEGKYYCLYIR